MSLATIAIFSPPISLSSNGNFIWVALFFFLATVGFSMVAIPYSAMAGEMTQDPKERSTLTAFRMAFASLGILLGGAIIPLIAGSTREGHSIAAITIAPIMFITIWLAIIFTRNAPRIDKPSESNFVHMLGLVFKNRSFIYLTVFYGVMTLAVATVTAGLPFAAAHLIYDDGQTLLSGAAQALGLLSLMFAVFVLGAILSQAVWAILSAKMGKLNTLLFGLSFYVCLLCLLFFNMPSNNVTWMAFLFIIAGFANGAYQQLPWAMYPDLMDQTRNDTGEALEGVFSGVWLVGQKLANALAPLVLALILGAYGWQETSEGIAEQSVDAVNALHYAVSLIPAAILLVSILGLLFIYRPSLNKEK